jgi:hypothetical protein
MWAIAITTKPAVNTDRVAAPLVCTGAVVQEHLRCVLYMGVAVTYCCEICIGWLQQLESWDLHL